jgi:hypothetical protein
VADDCEFVGGFHHFHLNAVEVSRTKKKCLSSKFMEVSGTKNYFDQVNPWKFLEQKIISIKFIRGSFWNKK